ncbi:MAG: 30S ribosomal protein S4, partial [Nanoarchaeota archaeon]
MGDIKKLKKKHAPLHHPWNKGEIEESQKLRKEYGLANHTEILIASSFLKQYKDLAKKLIASTSVQGEKEKDQMMAKLSRLSLLTTGATLDHVLSLQLKDILERRAQSLLFRKGLARSMKQSRQFILHRHVRFGVKEITSPGHLVTLEEESQFSFRDVSPLASEDHPERVSVVKGAEPALEALAVPISGEVVEPKPAEKKSAENKEPVQQKEKAVKASNENRKRK